MNEYLGQASSSALPRNEWVRSALITAAITFLTLGVGRWIGWLPSGYTWHYFGLLGHSIAILIALTLFGEWRCLIEARDGLQQCDKADQTCWAGRAIQFCRQQFGMRLALEEKKQAVLLAKEQWDRELGARWAWYWCLLGILPLLGSLAGFRALRLTDPPASYMEVFAPLTYASLEALTAGGLAFWLYQNWRHLLSQWHDRAVAVETKETCASGRNDDAEGMTDSRSTGESETPTANKSQSPSRKGPAIRRAGSSAGSVGTCGSVDRQPVPEEKRKSEGQDLQEGEPTDINPDFQDLVP